MLLFFFFELISVCDTHSLAVRVFLPSFCCILCGFCSFFCLHVSLSFLRCFIVCVVYLINFFVCYFFFIDPPATEIYTLPLLDAVPILPPRR